MQRRDVSDLGRRDWGGTLRNQGPSRLRAWAGLFSGRPLLGNERGGRPDHTPGGRDRPRGPTDISAPSPALPSRRRVVASFPVETIGRSDSGTSNRAAKLAYSGAILTKSCTSRS